MRSAFERTVQNKFQDRDESQRGVVLQFPVASPGDNAMRPTVDEVRGDLTNVDYLLSHVIDHIKSLLLLVDNGDDPSHAIKVLLADTCHTQNQFRAQYPSKGHYKRPASGERASWPYSAPEQKNKETHQAHVRGNGVGLTDAITHRAGSFDSGNLDYYGYRCEACDDD